MTVTEYRQLHTGKNASDMKRFMHGLLAVKRIGLDLGSSMTRLCLEEDGVVLSEPSAVTINRATGDVTGYGENALRLMGRSSASEEAVRPLSKGAIVDYSQTLSLIQYFLRESCGTMLRQPQMLISVPMSVNDAQKRFVLMAAQEAGAKNVYLMESVRAAAIGAGLEIGIPVGRLVVDIGAEVTDIAVLSLGGIVLSLSVDVAGKQFDEAVMSYVRNRYDLLVGELRAEKAKCQIGTLLKTDEPRVAAVRGRHMGTGLPMTQNISSTELCEVLRRPAEVIADGISRVIGRTPPELLPDLYRNGMMLTGGGAQLRGLPELLSAATGIPCTVASHPEDCTAEGLLRTLPHLDRMVEGMLVSDYVHRRKNG